MRRFVIPPLLIVALFGSDSARGGMLTPAEQNLLVATMAPTLDLLEPAVIFEFPGTNLFSGSGTIGAGGWQLTLSGMYQGVQASLTYSGLNDPATGIVSWSGTGSFGAVTWVTSGTATFTADAGLVWHQAGNIGSGGGDGDGFGGGYLKDGDGLADLLEGRIRILIDLINTARRTRPLPPIDKLLPGSGGGEQPLEPTRPTPYIPFMFDTMEPGFVWKTTAVRSEFSLDEPKFEWVVQCIPEPSSLTLAGIGILGVLIYGSWYRSR